MTTPGMIEGGFNMPISIDQLTRVVNSLVEVTSGNTLTPSLSGNTLMSSPTVLPIVTPTVSDSSNPGNNCFSQVIPTQPTSGFLGGNNMSSVHIPVSLTAQTVSMVPLMLSLNLANRSLTSAPDRNTIDRACLPTGVVNDKINSIVYSCANSSINQQVSGPITLPTVSMSVMENESTGCSSLAQHNSLDCVPTETASHQPNFQQISTVSYSSSTDNQTNSHDLNSTNPLMAASIQEPLAPNPSMMTPDLSTLADLRLGIGVVSQPETYTALPDSFSSLLQAANHFGQGQMQKNNITTAPCVLQTAADDRTLTDTSISAEQSLSANGLQSLLHQRPSELANSLDSLGLLTEKDNTNLVSSAMVLDVANMSVIDMILKVQHAENNNIHNEKIPECEEMTNTQLKGDNSSAAAPNETPQFAFEHFCLDCNAQLQDPCQIHNNNYSEISDSPLITRARLSLPSLLHLKNTSAQGYNNELGVWTKEAIPKKSRFGPLTAKVKSKCQVNCEKTKDFPIWMIFFPEESLADLLDVSDENECNWMMFVKPARTVAEQNLVAYQHHANIYFITSCDLQPQQELLVWYSKDYAQAIGVSVKADVPLNCSVCDTIFATHKRLSQHLKENHPEISVRRWRCQFCSRGFTSTTKLKTHLLTHIGVKPHSCNECGKQFTDQSNLRMHQTIHTGVRNFSCYVCQKQFRQKAHLKSHMFTHTGEKSLKCQFCDKMFSRSSDLKQHEYQHTKEKIFCCSHCDKSFYKMQNFKKHLKIHSGERNFSCTTCAKSFYTKYHLKRHSSSCKGSKSVVKSGTMMVLSEDVGVTLDDATDIVNEEVFQENSSEIEEEDESDKINVSNRLPDIDFTDDQ